MTVTLSQAGLSSGNGVIRLLFKHTKETLDSVQKKIQEVAQSLAVKLSTKEPVSVAPVVPESAQTSAPSAQVAVQNPSNGSHPVPNSNKVLSQSTEPGTEAVRQLNTPVKTPPPVISATPTAVPPTVETLDRQRALFRPPPDGHAMTRFELPDSFFELNPSEVKILLSETEARRKKAENAGFKTRALREQEDLERAQKYPKTCIRVRFPDRCSLQVNFLSSEQVSALYEQVQITLAEPNRPFTLYVTPPQRTLDPELSFYKSSLAPSSVVYLSWKDADASGAIFLSFIALLLR